VDGLSDFEIPKQEADDTTAALDPKASPCHRGVARESVVVRVGGVEQLIEIIRQNVACSK
jgi:hypothetical protein